MKKDKQFNLEKIILILILLSSIMFIVSYTTTKNIVFYDEGSYVGNGKNLFSGGELGRYESLRPPLMGLTVGALWAVGLDVVVAGKILISICFVLLIYLLYIYSEALYKGSGLITALITLASGVFLFWTNRLLTEIPSLLILVFGLYLFHRKKYYLAGLVISIGFLFRFSSALILIGLFIYLFIKMFVERSYLPNIKIGLMLAGGFLTLAVPYFIISKIFFGSFLTSITSGQAAVGVFGQNAWHNFEFFIGTLWKQNILPVFLLAFIILLIERTHIFTKAKNLKAIIPFSIAILSFLYFTLFTHTEARYMHQAIPFIALVAGWTLMYIVNLFKKNYKQYIRYAIVLVFFVLFIINGAHIIKEQRTYAVDPMRTQLLLLEEYFSMVPDGECAYVDEVQNVVYSDIKILGHGEYLKGIDRDKCKYFVIDAKNLSCSEDNSECKKRVTNLNTKLEEDQAEFVYNKVIFGRNRFVLKLN